MKYRKKPVVVDATQWFKDGDHPVVIHFRRPEMSPVPNEQDCKYCGQSMRVHGWIQTLEGGHIVCPGDWIITGVQGERYTCKPDIFTATYEAV